ncbi:MAG: protein kinase domain-containing protein [Marmoricola sp.]
MDVEEHVLGWIFLAWQRDLRWPTWGQLDRELYAAGGVDDPWEALNSVARSLLWGVGDRDRAEPEDSRAIGLSVLGLASVPAAREDLRIFLDSVRLAARLGLEPPFSDVELSPSVLAKHLTLPAAGRADLLARQRSVWQTVGWLWRSMSGEEGAETWTVVVDHKAVRRYADVKSAEDFQDVVSESARRAAAGSLTRTPLASRSESPEGELLVTSSGLEYRWFPEQELGRGGNGRVCAGLGPEGAAVAVKQVDLRGFDTSKWYRDGRYAEREEALGAHLRGRGLQHVLELIDSSLTEDALYLVFPRCVFSLGAVVRQVDGSVDLARGQDAAAAEAFPLGGPTAKDRFDIVVDLVRGVLELHDNGVVHRDIKPENALFHEGRWKWGDLGIGRLLGVATSTFTWREHGTLAYLAPEVALGRPASKQSDVYSLGCTIFALATGEPPFVGDADALMRQHREIEPDWSRVGDERLVVVLRWMLHKVAGSRPTAEWILDALVGLDGGEVSAGWASVSAAASVRQSEQAAARARMGEREDAVHAAAGQLSQVWAQLVRQVRRAVPSASDAGDREAFILTLGDRRLVIKVSEPADATCEALMLGTVTVEAENSDPRVEVANIVVFPGLDGVPRWMLWRMVRNDAAGSRKALVSESFSDAKGAASLRDLEAYLTERGAGIAAKLVTVADEGPLTADSLEKLLLAELKAIDAHLNGP